MKALGRLVSALLSRRKDSSSKTQIQTDSNFEEDSVIYSFTGEWLGGQGEGSCAGFLVQNARAGFRAVALLEGLGAAGREVVQCLEPALHSLLQDSGPLGSLEAVESLLGSALKSARQAASDRDVGLARSGCCLVAVVLSGSKLFVAGLGGCRAVLGRPASSGEWRAVELTPDHSLFSPAERSRIVGRGGWIGAAERSAFDGDLRVWPAPPDPLAPHSGPDASADPGIRVTRAFGVTACRALGLLGEPEVFSLQIRSEESFLILASELFWKLIPSTEACHILRHFSNTPEAHLSKAAKFLAEKARKKAKKLGLPAYFARPDYDPDCPDELAVLVLFLGKSPHKPKYAKPNPNI